MHTVDSQVVGTSKHFYETYLDENWLPSSLNQIYIHEIFNSIHPKDYNNIQSWSFYRFQDNQSLKSILYRKTDSITFFMDSSDFTCFRAELP